MPKEKNEARKWQMVGTQWMRVRVGRKSSDRHDRTVWISTGACRDYLLVEHVKYIANTHARAPKPVTMPSIIMIVDRFRLRWLLISSLHSGLDELVSTQNGIRSNTFLGSFLWPNPQQSSFIKLNRIHQGKMRSDVLLTSHEVEEGFPLSRELWDSEWISHNYRLLDRRTIPAVDPWPAVESPVPKWSDRPGWDRSIALNNDKIIECDLLNE